MQEKIGRGSSWPETHGKGREALADSELYMLCGWCKLAESKLYVLCGRCKLYIDTYLSC